MIRVKLSVILLVCFTASVVAAGHFENGGICPAHPSSEKCMEESTIKTLKALRARAKLAKKYPKVFMRLRERTAVVRPDAAKDNLDYWFENQKQLSILDTLYRSERSEDLLDVVLLTTPAVERAFGTAKAVEYFSYWQRQFADHSEASLALDALAKKDLPYAINTASQMFFNPEKAETIASYWVKHHEFFLTLRPTSQPIIQTILSVLPLVPDDCEGSFKFWLESNVKPSLKLKKIAAVSRAAINCEALEDEELGDEELEDEEVELIH